MMRTRLDYAVRLLVALYHFGLKSDRFTSMGQLATNAGISLQAGEYVAVCLRQFIDRQKGPGGGYRLNTKLQDISIKDVADKVLTKIDNGMWQQAYQKIDAMFAKMKVSDFIELAKATKPPHRKNFRGAQPRPCLQSY